ncbi:MAG: hydroxymethylbilane synthase [Chitinophagales bacterium]
MGKLIRIGTRESQLAIWQATQVLEKISENGFEAALVLIKSEGDIDLHTPLYEMGIQGIFTRSLDIALLSNKIDLAVHSMKDVPTQLAAGIVQTAVLKRGSHKDILVYKEDALHTKELFQKIQKGESNQVAHTQFLVATSSMRRKAQWLNKYSNHVLTSLRGNMNTRLSKLQENEWNGAIFAAAGLERINLRPSNAVDLDWMLPAPAQGAIVVLSRESDEETHNACERMNDPNTALCTLTERSFLRTLLGGCSTPISALAEIEAGEIYFRGNLLSPDGKQKVEIEKILPLTRAEGLGREAAKEILSKGGGEVMKTLSNVHG